MCFLCHSIVLCKTCNKCRKCCHKSACRGGTSKLLANLTEFGCLSESSSNPERGLYLLLSDPAKLVKIPDCHKLLCQSPQEPLPAEGIASTYRQKCSRAGTQSEISRVLQLTISSAQTQEQVETYTISEELNLFLKAEKFKMETPKPSGHPSNKGSGLPQ